MTIALVDALTGFKMQIDHLDGHKIVVERSKVTWPGARIAKKNEGMPNYENNNVRGTLFITFDVNFPKGELTEEDKAGERLLVSPVDQIGITRCLISIILRPASVGLGWFVTNPIMCLPRDTL